MCAQLLPKSPSSAGRFDENATSCRHCLIEPPRKRDAGMHEGIDGWCLTSPGILYRLRQRDAMDERDQWVCIMPSCPAAAAAACIGAPNAEVHSAVYWEALSTLLPWQVEGDGANMAAVPPGVPPYGRFMCSGPALPFYNMVVSHPWPAAHRCGENTFHPISFGIPEEDIVSCLPRKSVDFASLLPGRMETYIFPMTSFGELEYKRMYREVRFALNPKKSGWETMRIYEILAGGAVPIVKDLHLVPSGALAFLDKELLQQASSLVGIDATDLQIIPEPAPPPNLQINHSQFDNDEYERIAAALLRHTQQRLSTKAIARYLLAAVGKHSARRILYVASCLHGDYQCYLSLHGLRNLLGSGLVDYPRLDYMYKPKVQAMDQIDRRTTCPQAMCTVVSGNSAAHPAVIRSQGSPVPVYGGAFSYGFRLEDLPINRSEVAIMEQIRQRQFDAVVFGNAAVSYLQGDRASQRLHRIWRLVLRHYSPRDIVVIDGRDPPRGSHFHEGVVELAARGVHYFLREIPEDC